MLGDVGETLVGSVAGSAGDVGVFFVGLLEKEERER